LKPINIFRIDFDEKRNYGLDILRALAIFFVLNVHSAHFFKTDSYLFKILTTLNLDGVSLFFVLSGFLIGGILIKAYEKKDITFKTLFNFWIRRWFRTLPNYFLILTILLFLGFHYKTISDSYPFKNYYFFLANFKSALPDNLFPESWSLSIEEWFYLLVPLLIFILIAGYKFKPRVSFLAIAIIILVFSTCFRYYRLTHWPYITGEQIESSFRKQVITRLDSIMYGLIGAYLAFYHLSIWKKYRKPLFFIGIFILYLNFTQYIFGYFGLIYSLVFSYGLEALGFLCLFPYLTELKSGQGFIYKAITRTSIISYSLYLLNYSLVKIYIIGFLNRTLFKNIDQFYLAPVQYFSFWLITIVGAILLYKYFEKPFMTLRERI
jgi:peptidoglycan/LPS O-acetylase OafA/YrhL